MQGDKSLQEQGMTEVTVITNDSLSRWDCGGVAVRTAGGLILF